MSESKEKTIDELELLVVRAEVSDRIEKHLDYMSSGHSSEDMPYGKAILSFYDDDLYADLRERPEVYADLTVLLYVADSLADHGHYKQACVVWSSFSDENLVKSRISGLLKKAVAEKGFFQAQEILGCARSRGIETLKDPYAKEGE